MEAAARRAGRGERGVNSLLSPLIRALPTFSLRGRRNICPLIRALPTFSPHGRRHSGFTLIELLVVVLIIGILAAIALPQYEKAVEKSRLAEAKIILRHIANAQKAYYMANGEYAVRLDVLGIDIPGTVPEQSARKETTFFRYGAIRLDGGSTSSIAFASRKPYNTDYELWIQSDKEGIFCTEVSASAPHKGFCEKESRGQKINGTFVIAD